MLHAERAPDTPQDHVPRGTTPTWEMELLLSGATVFGLLQVPAFVDAGFLWLLDRAAEQVVPGISALWMYLKASVLTLSVTFVAHLALRAYWVAVVGMRSVYPGPLRWDRLRAGEVHREAIEPVAGDLAARIEAADNRATRVFALGVAIATTLLLPLVFVAAGLAISLAVSALGGPDVSSVAVMYGVGAVMGPFFLATWVDRLAGRRFPPGSRRRRALAAIFRGYHRIGFGVATNPLLAMFQSGEGFARTIAITITAILLAVTLSAGQFFLAMGVVDGPGDFAGLPASDPGAPATAAPGHYASQRGAGVVTLPYLPDRVVRGPYIELFVPYRPARLAPAMRAACGEAVAVSDREGPPEEALACLARLLDLRLDGAPVTVPLVASEDPQSGARGVLAMIPAQELAPGRHELTIRRLGRQGRAEPPVPFRIPFWR